MYAAHIKSTNVVLLSHMFSRRLFMICVPILRSSFSQEPKMSGSSYFFAVSNNIRRRIQQRKKGRGGAKGDFHRKGVIIGLLKKACIDL